MQNLPPAMLLVGVVGVFFFFFVKSLHDAKLSVIDNSKTEHTYGFDDELDDHDGVVLEDDDLVGVTEGASISACLQGHVSGSQADQEAVDEDVTASIEHPIPQLLSYHHFSVSSSHPGIINLRKFQDSVSKEFKLLKKPFGSSEFPALVSPNDLTTERQTYLYGRIRQYVEPQYQDRVFPTPIQATAQPTEAVPMDEPPSPTTSGKGKSRGKATGRGRGRARGRDRGKGRKKDTGE
uniref:Uncharacterized protein n=1 Tax=Capitella teleta TaxID=283909 RepID=X2A6E4_CAPTE